MENPLGQRLRELPGPLLLTGHTGFKGTWMTFLLENLNVPVVGYSLFPERDSLFDRAERIGVIPEAFADIRDYKALEQFIDLHTPSTIVHMAAQPLVLKSYENPRETFDVNVMGTVNVLDVAFKKDFVKAIIVVTTDKVYRNDNSGRAFVETDPLEGKDPYSASKVGTESVVAAWQQIAQVTGGPKVISVRAGNVIGGGDFAADRIIPDLVRSVLNDTTAEIRNPESIRPWQHVLDPLQGYLLALETILSGKLVSNLNFAPLEPGVTVSRLTNVAWEVWNKIQFVNLIPEHDLVPTFSREAVNLDLDSRKAREQINWLPGFTQIEAIQKTIGWWKSLNDSPLSASDLTKLEVQKFLERKEIE